MGRRKKLVNHTDIPEHVIEAIARCLLPDILEDYKNPEIQKEFAEWKAQRAEEAEKQKKRSSITKAV